MLENQQQIPVAPGWDGDRAPRRRVALIGLDGLRADLAIDGGLMPTLAAMARAGTRHAMTVAVPTLSGPSWATILTGVGIDEHRVRDNSFLGAELPRFPDLLSRAFYADQRRKTFAAASWPPLLDPDGLGPIIHERREQHRAGLHRVVVRDGETHGYVPLDADIVRHSLWALRHDTPDVSFVYLCDADESAHLHGARSAEYEASLRRLDTHLGALLAQIAERASIDGDDWLVVVTSDHGHLDEGGHGGDSALERTSFVVAQSLGNGSVSWPQRLEPTELTPRILDFLAA